MLAEIDISMTTYPIDVDDVLKSFPPLPRVTSIYTQQMHDLFIAAYSRLPIPFQS